MNAFRALTATELKLFFRERQQVFWTFLYPLLMIWLFGAIFGRETVYGTTYSNAYIPSWLGVNLLTISLYTIGTTLANYRETGVLKRYRATPLRSWAVLAAHSVYGLSVFLLSAAVMIAEGRLLFHLSMPRSPGWVLAGFALSVLALFPFGLFCASLARTTRASAAISTVVLNVMLLFSGATFPLFMFPSFLQDVARALPLYYVVDLLRRAWAHASLGPSAADVWVLPGIGVAAAALASWLFRRQPA